jgi:hypothetical protein
MRLDVLTGGRIVVGARHSSALGSVKLRPAEIDGNTWSQTDSWPGLADGTDWSAPSETPRRRRLHNEIVDTSLGPEPTPGPER